MKTGDAPTRHIKARVEDGWMTLAEVAARFKVSPRAVRFWIKDGKLRAEKVGIMWLVRREWAEAVRRP